MNTFSMVRENILPHNILRAAPLAALPGMKFRKINAKAIIMEKVTPIITSECSLAFSEIGPNRRAMRVEKPIAHNKGSMDMTKPKAAPAKAAWDMQKPMEERFMRTTNTPINEQTTPARTEPMIAVIIS